MIEEYESSVMQIQILDEQNCWTGRSIFLIMDDELDWLHVYLKTFLYGKVPNVNCSCKKVKYG